VDPEDCDYIEVLYSYETILAKNISEGLMLIFLFQFILVTLFIFSDISIKNDATTIWYNSFIVLFIVAPVVIIILMMYGLFLDGGD